MSKTVCSGACPLLDALPAEIRIQIYEYLLFENGSFFSLGDEEGNSIPTLFPKLRAPPRPIAPPVQPDFGLDPQAAALCCRNSSNSSRGSIMSLLLTSKQM